MPESILLFLLILYDLVKICYLLVQFVDGFVEQFYYLNLFAGFILFLNDVLL